jgi:hypothetical protein
VLFEVLLYGSLSGEQFSERVVLWNDGLRPPSWANIRCSAILFIVPVLGDEPQNKNDACRWVRQKVHRRVTPSLEVTR